MIVDFFQKMDLPTKSMKIFNNTAINAAIEQQKVSASLNSCYNALFFSEILRDGV
jgi:hypothetical protein